jgi:hypothetical protein
LHEEPVFQSVKKSRLADPVLSIDQLRLHDRDLARGSAERNETELEPEAKRLSEGGRRRTGVRD